MAHRFPGTYIGMARYIRFLRKEGPQMGKLTPINPSYVCALPYGVLDMEWSDQVVGTGPLPPAYGPGGVPITTPTTPPPEEPGAPWAPSASKGLSASTLIAGGIGLLGVGYLLMMRK